MSAVTELSNERRIAAASGTRHLKEWADTVLKEEGRTFIASNIPCQVTPDDRKLHLTAPDFLGYRRLEALVTYAPAEIFRDHVPRSQLSDFARHFEEVISNLTLAREWRHTGVFRAYDRDLLKSVVAMFMCEEFCYIVVTETSALSTLANLCNALNPNLLPSGMVADGVLNILGIALISNNHLKRFSPSLNLMASSA